MSHPHGAVSWRITPDTAVCGCHPCRLISSRPCCTWIRPSARLHDACCPTLISRTTTPLRRLGSPSWRRHGCLPAGPPTRLDPDEATPTANASAAPTHRLEPLRQLPRPPLSHRRLRHLRQRRLRALPTVQRHYGELARRVCRCSMRRWLEPSVTTMGMTTTLWTSHLRRRRHQWVAWTTTSICRLRRLHHLLREFPWMTTWTCHHHRRRLPLVATASPRRMALVLARRMVWVPPTVMHRGRGSALDGADSL